MREDEQRPDEAGDEAEQERPEDEPTSLEQGRSTKPGEGPLDEPAVGLGTHRGW